MFLFGRAEDKMVNYPNALTPEIVERKSITNWTKQKCTKDVWDLLMEAARRAPSSWNHQPARYILIQNEENIKKLTNVLHRTNKWAANAAGLIVQIANPEDDDHVSGKDYYLYDCGLAMMSLVYQAQLMGLSCRQMVGWDESEVKKLLNIPTGYVVVVITAIGYPSSSQISKTFQKLKRTIAQQHKRYHIKHLSYWEKWGEKSVMAKSNLYAPSFWMSPAVRKKFDKGRLYTDIIGLGIVYTFGGFIPASIQWLSTIYTMFAWVTILTIDPTRLPDAATTKLNQRKAWRYFGLSFPLFLVMIGIIQYVNPLKINFLSLSALISLLLNAVMIELYYRNILQVKFHQLGLSIMSSIGLQSIAFATHFYLFSHSLSISLGAFIIGVINGMVLYKTRSIYPNFLTSFLWVSLFSK